MSDTGPTDVDGIFVVGQRRRPDGTFPPAPGGGGPGGGSSGGEHQNQVEDPGTQPYVPPPHPCDNPEAALDWNIDAEAAKAKKEFERRGREEDGDEDYLSRERYAFILQRDDGSLYLSSIATGGSNWVNPNDVSGEVTPFNVVGMVHNHPGGSQTPSGDDWTGFDIYYNYVLQHAGLQRANQLRIYIIAKDTNSTSSALQIKVYNNQSSRNSDAGRDSESGGAAMSWSSIVTAALHLALANGQDHPIVAESTHSLRSFQHAGRVPEAVIQETTGERGDQVRTLAVFRHRDEGRSGTLSWRIRDTSAEGQVRSAHSEYCPVLYGLIVQLERVPLPRLEIRPEVDAAPATYQGRPPSIGRTHTSYALAASGFTAGNEPVFFRISHLGSGPIREWWLEADRQLDGCWRDDGALRPYDR